MPRCENGCGSGRGIIPVWGFRPRRGLDLNRKRVQRLWREEGLRVPQRRRRKRLGTSTITDTPVADAPNRVWAVDFQFDSTTDGRPIKIVSVIDEHTRECLGGLVARSITAEMLIEELDRLAAERAYPAVLRCDNGPELACAAMAEWAGTGVGLCFIPPDNRGATATSNRSTAASATNASASTSFGHWPRPRSSSVTGSANTTGTGRIPRFTTSLRPVTPRTAPTGNRYLPGVALRRSTIRLAQEPLPWVSCGGYGRWFCSGRIG
jgi:hypothetical protein